MSSLNIDEVLTKIDELRGLFELGQRTMPFLEELFHFVEEIEPLLGEIDASLRETTNKMPAAKSRLETVSEATEMATSEILDLVDSVAFELKMMQKALTRKTEGLDAVREADDRLLHLLGSELADEHPELLEEVRRIHRRKQPLLDEAIDHADDELEAVEDVRQKMTQITMSLQVQDITSQQIAAVNHIIESLRDRMSQLVDQTNFRIEHASPPEANPPPAEPASDGTFDENAQYDPAGDHQATADALIDSIRQPDDAAPSPMPSPSPDTTSRDVDASDPVDPSPPLGGDGEIAQEDIDELFS
ncbi:MAG: hypothetical protein GVY35_17170 [Bacteroidetes bacterium]|jgi:chemotaxis regulatin CheY-phosphate phosphatase CheZ|nr:hypothetical protein [Bacteroidota bacterium]